MSMSFIIFNVVTLEDYFVEFVGHIKLMFLKLKFKQINSLINVTSRVFEVMSCGTLLKA